MSDHILTENDIVALIQADRWMMDVLESARSLVLPDWMIGAGFVRNKVWDYLHGVESETVPTNDIDLIYYDASCIDEAIEKVYDRQLSALMDVEWSVKNQARMHLKHGLDQPFQSTEHALSEWVETPTCVAVRLESDGVLRFFAPHGIEDLVHLIVRPTPAFRNRMDVFDERVQSKGWLRRWGKLQVVAA